MIIRRIISILLATTLIFGTVVAITSCSDSTYDSETTAETGQEESVSTISEDVSAEKTENTADVRAESQMNEEDRLNEIAFVENLKSQHYDWYEDYIYLSDILECYGKTRNEVEKAFELEKSSYGGDNCYALVKDSWLGIEGQYVLTFRNGGVRLIEFIIEEDVSYRDDFHLLLGNMEEFLGQPATLKQSGIDYVYEWADNFHVANFSMYRLLAGNPLAGGIMFSQNFDYDYSILEQ